MYIAVHAVDLADAHVDSKESDSCSDTPLRTCSARHQSSRKERNMEDAVKEMKQAFGKEAVFGQLVQVCRIPEAVHSTAITVLMGRHMDSVVVSTMAVARACIRLLKEKKCEPMEFIPLDSVDVRISGLLVSRNICYLSRQPSILDIVSLHKFLVGANNQ